jgi:hypothetical protein
MASEWHLAALPSVYQGTYFAVRVKKPLCSDLMLSELTQSEEHRHNDIFRALIINTSKR